MKKQQYEVHPIADVFPMMTGEAFELLKEDIRVNGQREPIVFWKNMLVDGRNRLKACEQLGIEPDESELMDETDPVAWVVSHNLYRRHLTESQRAIIAGRLAKLNWGGDRGNQHTGGKVPIGTLPNLEQAADMLNVGRRSVARAKQVLDAGAPEIVAAVEAGELPVSFAAKVVTEEDDKKTQAKLWKQGGKQALKEHIKRSSDCADDAKRVLKKKPLRAPKSVTQQCENEVNEFLLFWEKRTEKGKKAIWLWLVDHYESS